MDATLSERWHQSFASLHNVQTTDADLLARYADHQDDDAFRTLVERHAGMVAGVCRKRLRSTHDAEDAFQATFLALARKAKSVHATAPVAAWIYGAAVKACQELLRRQARKPWLSLSTDIISDNAMSPEADVVAVVLEEVASLRADYRAAVVLCELEGRSRSAAARELGIPEGTLSSRLAAARKQLASRLSERGLAPATLLILGTLAGPAWAFEPSALSPMAQRIAEVIMSASMGKLKIAGLLFALLTPVAMMTGLTEEPKPALKPKPTLVTKREEPKLRVMTVGFQPNAKSPVDMKSILETHVLEPKTGFRLESREVLGGKPDSYVSMPIGIHSVSPDGKLWTHSQFRVVDTKGNMLPTFCVGPVHGEGKTHTIPEDRMIPLDWSPDSQFLYLTEILPPKWALLGNPKYRVWKMDLTTGLKTRVPLAKDDAEWSDDVPVGVTKSGEVLTIHTTTENILHKVQQLELRSPSQATRMVSPKVPGGFGYFASLAPDGRDVLYSVSKWKPKIVASWDIDRAMSYEQPYLLKAGEDEPHTLTLTGDINSYAVSGLIWSPDGQRLAMLESPSRNQDVNAANEHLITIFDDRGNKQVTYPLPAQIEGCTGTFFLSFAGWR